MSPIWAFDPRVGPATKHWLTNPAFALNSLRFSLFAGRLPASPPVFAQSVRGRPGPLPRPRRRRPQGAVLHGSSGRSGPRPATLDPPHLGHAYGRCGRVEGQMQGARGHRHRATFDGASDGPAAPRPRRQQTTVRSRQRGGGRGRVAAHCSRCRCRYRLVALYAHRDTACTASVA